jgi:hypothetical protein
MRDDQALVTIATFPTTFEASLARGALESIGIPALVPEETLIRSRGNIFPSRGFRCSSPTSSVRLSNFDV